jgi:internalin A
MKIVSPDTELAGRANPTDVTSIPDRERLSCQAAGFGNTSGSALDATAVTDAGVAHLARLNNLKKIHINGSKITDESLVLLSSLPSIESLSLQENHFSDKGFSCLQGEKRLKDLWAGLGDLQVTDAGLVHLKDFKYLQLLDLQNSKISAQGLEQLRGLHNLKSLWLGGTPVTKLEKQHFQQAMPNLKVVR